MTSLSIGSGTIASSPGRGKGAKVAPTYTVSLGAIMQGQTVGIPGSAADVTAVLGGADGSPAGIYTWSATVDGIPASLPVTAVAGTQIVLTIADAGHPTGAFSASSPPVTVSAIATVPAQMAPPSLVVDSSSQITTTFAADPADGGSAITGYGWRISTDEAAWTTVPSGAQSPFVQGDLAPSTLYHVQTRATNAVGNGAWSVSATATTFAAFVASINGLTDDPEHGEIAQIGVELTGTIANLRGGETIEHYWTLNGSSILGANSAKYTPVSGDDLGSLRYEPEVSGMEISSASYIVRNVSLELTFTNNSDGTFNLSDATIPATLAFTDIGNGLFDLEAV